MRASPPERDRSRSPRPIPEAAIFVEHRGYIPAGDDLLVEIMTIADAKLRCQSLPACKGFSLEGKPTDNPVTIWFKNEWALCDSLGWTSFKFVEEAGSYLYLPFKTAKGVLILRQQGHSYLVDNSLLKSQSKGLSYRNSKQLEDTDDGVRELWGNITHGIVEHTDDGVKWLKVLKQAEEDHHRSIGLIPGYRGFGIYEAITQLCTGPSRRKQTSEKGCPYQVCASSLHVEQETPHKFTWKDKAVSMGQMSKWKIETVPYDGDYAFPHHQVLNKEKVIGPIRDTIERLKANPAKYEGCFYPTEAENLPEYLQVCTLVERCPGFKVHAKAGGARGWNFLHCRYQALDRVEVDVSETSRMTKSGRALGKPVLPGRGDGIADVPEIKLVYHVDPNDILQGFIGDCWLLSAISTIAEFEGAIEKIFSPTENLRSLPVDSPNSYSVVLWDLPTWQPKIVTVDESLCTTKDGELLGCKPSKAGELWTCYLEKAVAKHCGGWDELDGGKPPRAWKLLTGCKECYSINMEDDGYRCFSTLNPNTMTWEGLNNSPHSGFTGIWPAAWPKAGGGGDLDQALTRKQLFARMCVWKESNFMMTAASARGDASHESDGILDGHGYSVLACHNNIGETGIGLVKLRNPWGHSEFDGGMWVDDGLGWTQYPQVKQIIKPTVCNDGMFYMNVDEFFDHFVTVYLCALDMKKFAGRK